MAVTTRKQELVNTHSVEFFG